MFGEPYQRYERPISYYSLIDIITTHALERIFLN